MARRRPSPVASFFLLELLLCPCKWCGVVWRGYSHGANDRDHDHGMMDRDGTGRHIEGKGLDGWRSRQTVLPLIPTEELSNLWPTLCVNLITPYEKKEKNPSQESRRCPTSPSDGGGLNVILLAPSVSARTTCTQRMVAGPPRRLGRNAQPYPYSLFRQNV